MRSDGGLDASLMGQVGFDLMIGGTKQVGEVLRGVSEVMLKGLTWVTNGLAWERM